jgi:hypothetical protein
VRPQTATPEPGPTRPSASLLKATSVSALTQLEAPLMLVEDCESEEAPGQPVVQYTAGQSRVREREPLPQVTDQPDQAVHVAQVPAWAARGQQKSQRHFEHLERRTSWIRGIEIKLGKKRGTASGILQPTTRKGQHGEPSRRGTVQGAYDSRRWWGSQRIGMKSPSMLCHRRRPSMCGRVWRFHPRSRTTTNSFPRPTGKVSRSSFYRTSIKTARTTSLVAGEQHKRDHSF